MRPLRPSLPRSSGPLKRTAIALLCGIAFPALLPAQEWDFPARLADTISAESKFRLSFEWRDRYETRSGTAFGKDPDIDTGLVRTRLGLSYAPVKWLKLSGMVQDARAPWYGSNAPNTVRDQADLHESYLELFPGYKRGFGMTVGRMMLNYGDARLIGVPQWSNLARTYDHARLYYRLPRARLEFLLVSPVKIRIGEFNRPVLGDRVWGVYNVFPNLYREHQLDVYVLRHDQNREGGFTGGTKAAGTDRLGVNAYGLRLTGPATAGTRYTVEAVAETGNVAAAQMRAGAWVATLSRRFLLRSRTLDVLGEYKFASGTGNPADATHTGTFDQLYPANHDKFGHEDLFGWRNLHNARSVTTLGITKALALNFMYDNYWLASPKDALYNGAGKSIALSAAGTAGRHVGQETDLFATFKYNHFLFGAGWGHVFAGEFLRKTTPGAGPTYLYIFHTYSF